MKEAEDGVKVTLTPHSMRRLEECFCVRDRASIKRVFGRAFWKGLLSANGGDALIEYGCLLIAGSFDGDGTFAVSTVFNLTNGISEKLKEQMWNGSPTPWKFSEIVLPQKDRGDVHE